MRLPPSKLEMAREGTTPAQWRAMACTHLVIAPSCLASPPSLAAADRPCAGGHGNMPFHASRRPTSSDSAAARPLSSGCPSPSPSAYRPITDPSMPPSRASISQRELGAGAVPDPRWWAYRSVPGAWPAALLLVFLDKADSLQTPSLPHHSGPLPPSSSVFFLS